MNISQVALKYDLSADTLRYYEKIGLITPNRKSNGIRDYDEDDLKRVEFIKCMRNAGLTIEFLIKYIKLYEMGSSTVEERKELLLEQRRILLKKMDEIKNTIEKLDYKIENYDKICGGKK